MVSLIHLTSDSHNDSHLCNSAAGPVDDYHLVHQTFRSKLKLRGLPDGVTFDKYYTMNTDWMINGHYTFDGFTISYIMYDSWSDVWRLELRTDPGGYFAKTEAGQEKDYPFGTRIWNITSQYYNGSVALNLNGCDDFHQYNCRDGSCIPIVERHESKCV